LGTESKACHERWQIEINGRETTTVEARAGTGKFPKGCDHIKDIKEVSLGSLKGRYRVNKHIIFGESGDAVRFNNADLFLDSMRGCKGIKLQ